MSGYATYEIEKGLIDSGYSNIVGIDEVGRGCGFGPVVAAAVYIPPESINLLIGKVRDSKKISSKKREELYDVIIKNCVYSFDMVDNKIIDSINILNATKKAMLGALKRILNKKNDVDFVVVDGPITLAGTTIPQQSIIDGDSLCLTVASASIVAKVIRDNLIVGLHDIYPEYGLKSNKGYLTKQHIEAIKKYGTTEFHRTSFNKVGNL